MARKSTAMRATGGTGTMNRIPAPRAIGPIGHMRPMRGKRLASTRRLPAQSFLVNWNEQMALRLGASLLLGALIGLNRDLRGKPAGLCTHALVSLGAALATIMVLNAPGGAMAADPNAIGRVV